MSLSPASARLRRKLTEIARIGSVLSYGNLMLACGIENRFALSEQLGEVSDDCRERNEPLLSALAVGKETMTPAGGFFAKAMEHADYSGSEDEGDRIRWWSRYLAEVHVYWRHRAEGDGE